LILKEAESLLQNPNLNFNLNLYGTGNTGKIIVEILLDLEK